MKTYGKTYSTISVSLIVFLLLWLILGGFDAIFIITDLLCILIHVLSFVILSWGSFVKETIFNK